MRADATGRRPRSARVRNGAAIRPDYARLPVPRIAAGRGLDEAEAAGLVESKIQGGDLGYLSEPTVNVLELTLAPANLDGND